MGTGLAISYVPELMEQCQRRRGEVQTRSTKQVSKKQEGRGRPKLAQADVENGKQGKTMRDGKKRGANVRGEDDPEGEECEDTKDA